MTKTSGMTAIQFEAYTSRDNEKFREALKASRCGVHRIATYITLW